VGAVSAETHPRKLSVLIPAYREERTIGEVLRRVAAADTERLGIGKEILVCDDGSNDGTAAAVEAAARTEPRIRLLKHPRNRGKGAAIRTLLDAATGDLALIQDADLEYDTADYPALLQPFLNGHDAQVVYGSRFLKRRRPTGMHPANFLGNKLLTFTANALYRQGITDEATCFKVFRIEVLRSLALECEGFEFCPEVTSKLGVRRVPIVEVPIEYNARSTEEGKKVRWTDAIEALAVMLKHRLRRSRERA
jgi:glycosyltransferase involved in cell wall biosynthesis